MEDKYLKGNPVTRKKLVVAGGIFLAIGAVLAFSGFASFFLAFTHPEGGMPKFFFLAFIGLPLCALGVTLLAYGMMGKVARYTANETAPVAKDVANYMLDGTRDEFVKTAQSTKGNIEETVYCPKCGTRNDKDAKYCDNCGKSLSNVCSYCGEANDLDAKYCDNCGKKL